MFGQEGVKHLFVLLSYWKILLTASVVDQNQDDNHGDYGSCKRMIPNVILQEILDVVGHVVK